MRILLVGNYPLDDQQSMSRYAGMLQSEMLQRGHEVELITPGAFFGRWHRGGTAGKWLGYIDKYLLFPWVLRRAARRFDLVHVCDHSNSMYLPYTAGRPKSIACHDLLAVFAAEGRYPQQRISATGKLQQRWIRRHLRKAPRVVCVSHFTAEQFKELGARADQVRTVIPNPLNYAYAPAAPEAVSALRAELGLGVSETYLLHVGGDIWYKNRAGAVCIYRLLVEQLKSRGLQPPRLILAGMPWSDAIRQYVVDHALDGLVIERVQPANEELQALYTGAQALLFPSLYEGFGWPLLEAQSCGCPVITSGRPPMNEVAGAGALLIDPENEAEAAQTIAEHLDSLDNLREAGFNNLKRFDRNELMLRYEEFFLAAQTGRRG